MSGWVSASKATRGTVRLPKPRQQITAHESQPRAVEEKHSASTVEQRLQLLDLGAIHQCRRADAEEAVPWQLGCHGGEGLAEQVRLLSNVQGHAIVHCL
jgi:hypothetical protein